MNIEQLSELFAKLGAKEPEQWSRSEIEENIPQRARFLFLRQAWNLVVKSADDVWISEAQEQVIARPLAAGAAIGPALARLLGQGANSSDITTVVRVMQWRLLAGLCYLLEDPGELEPEVQEISWGLFQIDDAGRPIAAMRGLHESVLETEPEGHQMKPTQAVEDRH